MKTKYFAIAIQYLLVAILATGCAGLEIPVQVMNVAPIAEGDVYNLFQGTARWLAYDGDYLVKSFYNAQTGVLVHSRPLMDGYAVACENVVNCNTLVGYFTNIKTWDSLRDWLVGMGGFSQVARAVVPTLRMPSIFVVPMILPAGYQEGDDLHAWDVMPCFPPMCGEYDNGQPSRNSSFLDLGEDDGFAEVEIWNQQSIP